MGTLNPFICSWGGDWLLKKKKKEKKKKKDGNTFWGGGGGGGGESQWESLSHSLWGVR